MIINEIGTEGSEAARLAALAQFLIGRAENAAGPKKISTRAFVNLAQNMGIAITPQQLIDMSQTAPLNNLIASVQGDDIIFKGSEEEVGQNAMSVDQARDTVNSMAKRAIDIK